MPKLIITASITRDSRWARDNPPATARGTDVVDANKNLNTESLAIFSAAQASFAFHVLALV